MVKEKSESSKPKETTVSSKPVELKEPVLKKNEVQVNFGNVEAIKIGLLNSINQNQLAIISLLQKLVDK